MKVSNIGKKSMLCLGFLSGVSGMPVSKRDNDLKITENDSKCIDIPQQHIEDMTKEAGTSIIKANKSYLELLNNDEQRRFYDDKYYSIISKNWNNFVLNTEPKVKIEDIEKIKKHTKDCINVHFLDAKEEYGDDYMWYQVAENIGSGNLVVPLSKPILPGIDELNKIYSNVYFKDKIAYISLNDYENCVKKEIESYCKEKINWKEMGLLVILLGTVGVLISKLDSQEKIERALDNISRRYNQFNDMLDRCINYISRKLIGRDIIEYDIDMFDMDDNSIVSENRTIAQNNIQEIDITECDKASDITLF